ncbi:MAG: glycosyltransferase family 2 protein [Elusimicrobiota bacterium]|nr:glycosyltransferase family 2 protein [Elusimicrobiota bacterium]
MSVMAERLSIVVPAYNEEDAIDDILRRCLEARAPLASRLGLSGVEVIVVNDGSRDKTLEKAGRWAEARVVSHPVNRGYGAALMTGFRAADGELVGFLDADGTCDPLAFEGLVKALRDGNADMAVGLRLHGGSRMPLVRVIGNKFYAALLTGLTGQRFTDTASGMRVFKKALLPRMAPLPTGLDFTPAMTARVACMGGRIVESPIPYAERTGESKLSVIGDGFRFLRSILSIVFAYFPFKVFGPLGAACLAVAFAYGLGPVRFYLGQGRLQEDMIYRLLTVLTLGVAGATFLAFGLLAQKAADAALGRSGGFFDRPGPRAALMGAGVASWLAGIALNARTIAEYAATGRITLHWSYVLTGSLAVLCGTVLVSLAVALVGFSRLPRPDAS